MPLALEYPKRPPPVQRRTVTEHLVERRPLDALPPGPWSYREALVSENVTYGWSATPLSLAMTELQLQVRTAAVAMPSVIDLVAPFVGSWNVN